MLAQRRAGSGKKEGSLRNSAAQRAAHRANFENVDPWQRVEGPAVLAERLETGTKARGEPWTLAVLGLSQDMRQTRCRAGTMQLLDEPWDSAPLYFLAVPFSNFLQQEARRRGLSPRPKVALARR